MGDQKGEGKERVEQTHSFIHSALDYAATTGAYAEERQALVLPLEWDRDEAWGRKGMSMEQSPSLPILGVCLAEKSKKDGNFSAAKAPAWGQGNLTGSGSGGTAGAPAWPGLSHLLPVLHLGRPPAPSLQSSRGPLHGWG